ncbi:MAG: DUF1566 domain-containing protein [Bacteroidetes bacterium]|nr:DUF1566 domain-containing protein [Bacteroidota bacterium]
MKSRLKYFIPLLLLFVFTACNRSDCNNGRKDGDEREIDCGGSCPDCPPSVTTKPVSSVATTTATFSMDYYHTTGTSKSSEGFIEKGFCYGTSINPTIDNYVNAITGNFNASGDHTISITNLTPETTYHVRGYIKDKTAIAYGNDITFATLQGPLTIITSQPTAITSNSASVVGSIIINTSSYTIISKGICYGTSANPTINNLKVLNNGAINSFTCSLTGMIGNTTYYVRAFAETNNGVFYGNEVSFMTGNVSAISIGQNYQGGIIFYIDNTNQHGLIAATNDYINSVGWTSGFSYTTNALDSVLGTGDINTNKIISISGTLSTYAASVCYNSTMNSYNDWFLPSKFELNLLRNNLYLSGVGNFNSFVYWSSTECANGSYAWAQVFSTGQQISSSKNLIRYVRPIRKF